MCIRDQTVSFRINIGIAIPMFFPQLGWTRAIRVSLVPISGRAMKVLFSIDGVPVYGPIILLLGWLLKDELVMPEST